MDTLKIEGQVKKIFPAQQISEKFTKREFVVETMDDYPQVIKFECTQQKVELLDNFAEGDQVSVSFNVRGREWISPKDNKAKYFVTLQAWRIENAGGFATTAQAPATNTNDDLPF